MRSPLVRRFVIGVAVLALVVPAGVAVATPPVGVTSTVLGKGTLSQRVKVNTPNIKAKFKKPPTSSFRRTSSNPVAARAGTATPDRHW